MLLPSQNPTASGLKIGDTLDNGFILTAIDRNQNYTWAGTDKGLFRFSNKNNKKHFYPLHTNGFVSDYVTSVCCRANGQVWIGTLNGMLEYDGYGFIVYCTENSKLPENHVTAISEDKNEDLWIGTEKSGVVKIHHNHFYTYNHFNSTLPFDIIKTIGPDAKGKFVINASEKDSVSLASIQKNFKK